MEDHADRNVISRFLDEYNADLDRGEVRDRTDYIAQFPGHAEAVGAKFDQLEGLVEFESPDPALTECEAGPGSGSRPDLPFESLGPYRIRRLLGRGGQGEVYLAMDTRLRRLVALKVLTVYSRESLERFRREAETASSLEHSAICTVYEAGIEDGRAFIAMRYVRGQSLALQIAATQRGEASDESEGAWIPLTNEPSGVRMSRRQRTDRLAQFFEVTARALHAAHEAGLVHRDVKPANIMVTPGGSPVLLDFGLARAGGSSGNVNAALVSIGTPPYMSPEQLRSCTPAGQGTPLDGRTDIWSLGVTMYETLTLRRPFEVEGWRDGDAPVLEARTQTPSEVARFIPDELEKIVMRALEKAAGSRYPSAAELADDLARFRRNEPVRARRAGPWLRLRKWAQRRPMLAGAAVSLCVLSVWLAAELQASTKNAALHAFERGVNDARTGDFKSALARFEEAEGLGYSDLAELELSRIDALDGSFEVEAAQKRLDRLLTLSATTMPAHHLARARIFEALFGRGKKRAAPGWKGLERIRNQPALWKVLVPADRHFIVGQCAESAEDCLAAMRLALKAEPQHRFARHTFAVTLAATGRFQEAREEAASLVAMYSKSPTAGMVFAWCRAVDEHEQPLEHPAIQSLEEGEREHIRICAEIVRIARRLVNRTLVASALRSDERKTLLGQLQMLGPVLDATMQIAPLATRLRRQKEPSAHLRFPRCLIGFLQQTARILNPMRLMAGIQAVEPVLDRALRHIQDPTAHMFRSQARAHRLLTKLVRKKVWDDGIYREMCADLEASAARPSLIGTGLGVPAFQVAFHALFHDLVHELGLENAFDHAAAVRRNSALLRAEADVRMLAWLQRRHLQVGDITGARVLIANTQQALARAGRKPEGSPAYHLAVARMEKAEGRLGKLRAALEKAQSLSPNARERREIHRLDK